jgi:hypothetical protein
MGMLALLLLLGGCGGTVRQITDDGKSDAPELIAFRPTAGVSGEEVQFEVLVNDLAGTLGRDFQAHPEQLQGLQYVWNFGGGAYPNSVISSTPVVPDFVTLRDGIRSPYNGTLTILGNRSAEDRFIYNFTFTVAPLAVATVGPTNGVENTNATFSAVIASGNVDPDSGYLWDFGGACDPNGSNEQNPSVSFVKQQWASEIADPQRLDVSRDFQARLIVSNNYEVTEFPFVIRVLREAE